MEGDEELDLVLQKEYAYALQRPDEDDDDYWVTRIRFTIMYVIKS